MTPGLLTYIPGGGTFTVIGAPPSANTVYLANSGDPNNFPTGTQVNAGTVISPANLRGPSGPSGPNGPPGPPGPQGVSGTSVYTTLKQLFSVPVSTGIAFVQDASTFAAGQIVYVQSGGYFSVQSVDSVAETLTLVNQNYPGSPPPGTSVAVGNTISGTGPQGPQGIQGPAGPQGPQGLTGLAPTGSIMMWGTPTPPGGWLLCQGQSVPRAQYGALFSVISTTYGSGTPNDGSMFNLPNLQSNFPIGASATYPLASTGGEATHALTAAEGPIHTHAASQPDHYHLIPGAGNHAHSATMPDHQHGLPPFAHSHTNAAHAHTYTQYPQGQAQGASGAGAWTTGGGIGAATSAVSVAIDAWTSPVMPTYYSSQYGGQPAISISASGNITPNTNYESQTMGAVGAITVANAGQGVAHNNIPPYLALNFIIKT
jgi:microcystin-dependent protein